MPDVISGSHVWPRVIARSLLVFSCPRLKMTTWWGLSVESHCCEYIFHISQVCLCPAYRGLSHRIISTYLCELPQAYCSTVYWEIFAVNFHGCQYPQRLHARNFFQQWNSVTVFLIQEVCCHPQNTLGNCCICISASRRSHLYRI